jgi:hypothetical protein
MSARRLAAVWASGRAVRCVLPFVMGLASSKVREARRRLVAAERREREKDRREELKRQVDTWSRSHEIRAYIAALRESAQEHVAREPDGRLARWIRWTEQYVEQTDPLNRVKELPLDPEGYGRVPLDLAAYAISGVDQSGEAN